MILRHIQLVSVLVVVSTAGSAISSEGYDLPQLLSRMRDSERLYANVEVHYLQSTEWPTIAEGADPAKYKKSMREQYRCVWQDSWYLAECGEESVYYDGHQETSRIWQAFDGQKTQINFRDTAGNIIDSRVHPISWAPPHRLGDPMSGGTRIPDMISFSPTYAKIDPRAEKFSRVDSRLVGEETLGALRCLKVESNFVGVDGKASGRFLWWISPARNWLVVKSEQYLASCDAHPLNRQETDDWREVTPGMWLPFRCVMRVYPEPGAEDPQPDSVITYTVDDVRFDPDYPVEFFRDVPMPKDAPVYVVSGGTIVETLINGVPEQEEVPVAGGIPGIGPR